MSQNPIDVPLQTKRRPSTAGYDAPRARWARLILPFLVLAVGVAFWRTDAQTWKQIRSAVFAAVQTHDEATTAPAVDGGDAVAAETFAGKGEIDVDGGLVKIFPLAFGEIEDIPVRENERVQSGAVLMRIRNRTASLLVKEAEQGIRLAAIELEKARRAPEDLHKQLQLADVAVQAEEKLVGIAQRNLDHLRTLAQQVSQEAINSSNDALIVAQQRLDAKRLERDRLKLRRPQEDVQVAQAAHERAETKLAEALEEADRYVVRARTSGRILRLNASVGETISAAMREPAFLLCPDKPWIVKCEVEQEFAARVVSGMPVEIRDDATGEKVGEGVVDRLSGVFAPRRQPVEDIRLHNDFRTMECTISLKTSPQGLRIGQHVRALFRPKPAAAVSP